MVRGADGDLQIASVAEVGEAALVVHDAHREDPSLAFALSRLADARAVSTPIGIFRQAPRETGSSSARGRPPQRAGELRREGLSALLHAADTWSVGG